jgi:hypothetical protein
VTLRIEREGVMQEVEVPMQGPVAPLVFDQRVKSRLERGLSWFRDLGLLMLRVKDGPADHVEIEAVVRFLPRRRGGSWSLACLNHQRTLLEMKRRWHVVI